ncbi:hypothetical protein HZA57_05010 [Candidatus Poribacteria bacterium]|nr:hypothetical protein [Candidatus Poribacteria bacterium]
MNRRCLSPEWLAGTPASRREWVAVLLPAWAVYMALVWYAADLGLAILSDDDHIRWYFAKELFKPVPEDPAVLGWPWGHLLILRLMFDTAGRWIGELAAGVLPQAAAGLLAITAMGGLTHRLGGRRSAIVTSTVSLAAIPWTVLLGLSMLSDLPNLALLLTGLFLHADSLRVPGRLGIRRLLTGDAALICAMTVRYESWGLGAVAAVLTTIWVGGNRLLPWPRFLLLTVLRAVMYAAFPAGWLALQAIWHDGDYFWFRTALHEGADFMPTLGEEWSFLMPLWWLTSPAVAILAVLAAWSRLRHRRAAPASRLVWYPALLAAAYFVMILAGELTMGRGSNLPERYLVPVIALLLPIIGEWADSMTSGPWRKTWLFCLLGGVSVCLHAILTREPYVENLPVALTEYAARMGQNLDYGSEDRLLFACTWDEYPAPLIVNARLHRYQREVLVYGEDDARDIGRQFLRRDTRFVLTSNTNLLRFARDEFPGAPVYREKKRWYLLDNSPGDGEAERKLFADEDVEAVAQRAPRRR